MAGTNIVIEPSSATGASDESEWVPMSRGNIATKVAIAALAAATLLTACTNPSDPGPVPATASSTAVARPTATPSPATPSTPQHAAILEAYNGYWRVSVAMLSDPSANLDGAGPHWNELRQFATDTALADQFTTLHDLSQNGIALVGAPVLNPSVANVTGQTASIVDCVDSTNWQPVYTATKKSAAAPGQNPRLITNSTLQLYDGRWQVTASVIDREKSC